MRSILLAAVMSVASLAQAAPHLNSDRALVIDGVIEGGNLSAVTEALDGFAASSDHSPVDLIINSPGGSVTTGFLFLNHMAAAQAQGIEIRCFVPNLAASMAYQILVQCDKRYALNDSFLLWHRVRTTVGGMFGAPMTAPAAKYLFVTLQKLDNTVFHQIHRAMYEVPVHILRYHFENETLHMGSDVAEMAPSYLQSYRYIPGLYEALRNTKLPRTTKASIFGLAGDDEIIYQTTKINSSVWTGDNNGN